MTEQATTPADKKAAAHRPRGIECPSCGCKHLHVLITRTVPGGYIRRRRRCRNCGRKITTYEHSIG